MPQNDPPDSFQPRLVCPKCKSDEFSFKQDKLSWLLGQQCKCAKCGEIFRGRF